MAQRKPPSGGKPAAKKGTSRPSGKPGTGPTARASSAGSAAARKQPPTRKPGKSIVNQKQTPWGLIASVVAVVLFAAAVIVVVIVTQHKSASGGGGCGSANANWCKPELAEAKQISGVTYKQEPNHTHVDGVVHYDAAPPIGGDHNAFWADCDGTVYPAAIASENAVHALEHGAVWVTYREGLPADEVATLAKNVTGQQKVFMSPYPGLQSKVSLQAWGYQLFVNSVTDPRIAQFIATLANNPSITPENTGCAQPTFKAHPSTFGQPLSAPVAGSANTMPGSTSP